MRRLWKKDLELRLTSLFSSSAVDQPCLEPQSTYCQELDCVEQVFQCSPQLVGDFVPFIVTVFSSSNFDEIFVFLTFFLFAFWSKHKVSHILSSWMVHIGCFSLAGIPLL